MKASPLIHAGAALLALLLASGCGGESPSLSSEMDDSYYRDGQQLERQGRWDEALSSYLKVIDRRGDAAPESNLEVGIIYLDHIKDPIFAVYHFRRYLELEPNSKKAPLVRGMIDSAKREFAQSLPGQPMDSDAQHFGVEEQAAQLRRENEELKAENAALRAGEPVPASHSSAIDLSVLPTPQPSPVPAAEAASSSPISLAPVDGAEAAQTSAISDAPEESAPTRPSPQPAQARGRHHTVAKGDTLYSLAQRYYGSRSRWRDIFAANRDVLSSENAPLKIGTDLKIP